MRESATIALLIYGSLAGGACSAGERIVEELHMQARGEVRRGARSVLGTADRL
jgi:hypothetical protein